MIKTGIVGACGRMGRENALVVHHSLKLELSHVVERSDHQDIGKNYREIVGDSAIDIVLENSIARCCEKSQVIVDFSHPQSTLELVRKATLTGTSLVIGTTGFSSEELTKIKSASEKINIVMSGNFSTGVNLLLGLVKKSAQVLGTEYNIEIMEQHHNQKIDAPSGTAIMLGKAAAKGRGIDYDDSLVTGRRGPGKRRDNEIGLFALRGGGVVGHHTVYFMGPNDKVELTHVAQNRKAFSNGVEKACQWVVEQKPGLYNMLDVLGLN